MIGQRQRLIKASEVQQKVKEKNELENLNFRYRNELNKMVLQHKINVIS